MKPVFIASAIVLLAASLPLSASAQPSPRRALAKPTTKEVGGVETIKPQEEQSKSAGEANGWSGAYAGVNAGGGFGATTGANVVVPFGSAGKSEK